MVEMRLKDEGQTAPGQARSSCPAKKGDICSVAADILAANDGGILPPPVAKKRQRCRVDWQSGMIASTANWPEHAGDPA
jgi:hypothetical protein